MGHGARTFPDTRWSMVLAGDRGVALEHLAAAYWRPVYGYVRARSGRGEADALDATQEFFVRLVESDLIERADRGRGRFRSYVRAALANFLVDETRKREAQSRGGGRRFVPQSDFELFDVPDAKGRSPDEVLDELWRAEVLERAASALERELVDEGKEAWWALFREYIRSDGEPSHAELALRHRVTRVDVSNWLARCRVRYRKALIRIVRETVEDERALADELAWLLGEAAS